MRLFHTCFSRLLILTIPFFLTAPPAPALTPCTNGSAAGFPCANVDLLSVVSLRELGFAPGIGVRGSDVWGWTEPRSGREFALYNVVPGTAFVEVTDPENAVHLGTLPPPGELPVQGDVKVYGHHAYVVGEGADDHGLQIFNLRRLLRVAEPPQTFTANAHYDGFGHAHNLAINEQSGHAYVVGSNTCQGGLHMLDLTAPENPRFVGCLDEVGSIHDTQCVDYHGPDRRYAGREICVNSGGTSLSIFDVTDKAAPRRLARIDYPGRGFAHQGWLTEDHAHFVLDDEGDEGQFEHNTRTYVFDFRDLDDPRFIDFYESTSTAVDHNLYIVGDYVFAANYTSGLRVLRLDDVASGRLSEAGYFDVFPAHDERSSLGAWTAYPFFESGTVVVSTRNQGLFLLRPNLDVRQSCHLAVGDPDYCAECGPCGAARGNCRGDDQCRDGLICAEGFGRHFGLSAGAGVCVAPRSVALDYRPVELAGAHPRALNERGQVVGWADDGDGGRQAFRYTPGTGFETLAPPGAAGSEGVAVTDAGHVFGRLVTPLPGGAVRQTGLFRYRDAHGFDFLEQGSNRAFRARFEILDVNHAGDVVGVHHRNRQPRLVPFLFTEGDGWIDLSALDPRLRETSTRAVAVNDRADVLFATEPSPTEARHAYLLRGGERLLRLGHLGRPVTVPLDLNDRGQIVGYSETARRERHAFFAPPERPLVDLHRGRSTSSEAGWITERGVVGGVYGGEALFTFDPRRTPGIKVWARPGDFAALLPAGAVFERLEVVDMNERVELVGRVVGRLPGDQVTGRLFYFSPAVGLIDLQAVPGESGAVLDVVDVTAINDRGFVLVRTADDGAAVLLPSVD